MSLSNRSLWILIILWFIWVWYIYYQYFFVKNLVSLNIDSNINWYNVELYNLKTQKNINCPDKICSINEISPFEYDIKITKKDYEIYIQKIDLSKSKTIKINLEKTLIFTKIETLNLTQTWSEDKKTMEDIISEKTSKKQRTFSLDKKWKFIFIQNNEKIDLKYEDKIIWSFDKLNLDILDIQNIYWSKDDIFIKSKDLSYIFNLKTWGTYSIELKSDISYIKDFIRTKSFQIVTKDWTFLYDINTRETRYFSKYNDFVSIDNYNIFILNTTDESRRKNFSFEKETWNLIVLFNNETKTKRILKSLNETISKIYLENEKVYIEDEKWDKYLLDNWR